MYSSLSFFLVSQCRSTNRICGNVRPFHGPVLIPAEAEEKGETPTTPRATGKSSESSTASVVAPGQIYSEHELYIGSSMFWSCAQILVSIGEIMHLQ